AGLDIVHQRFTLPGRFTVAEALELASAKKEVGSFFSFRSLESRWNGKLKAANIPAKADALVQDLPVEVVQSLEILRALSNDANILILDEPTALLSPAAIDALFARIRRLKAAGVTILLILHKLSEVLEIADTVMVLRNGELVLPPAPVDALSAGAISDLMIGGSAVGDEADQASPPSVRSKAPPHLSLKTVYTPGTTTEPALKDISLEIYPGEIVGVAGIEGNGQRSLVTTITGQTSVQEGEITLLQKTVTRDGAIDRRRAGLRAVPFDRLTEGSSLDLPLWENVMAWQSEKFARPFIPWLPVNEVRQAAKEALDRFGVIYSELDQPASSLSGGNLQRLILARELSDEAEIVIAAQPTRGLDFQATNFVWQVLGELRQRGAGVLLISSDLDELFKICDRLLVMRAGQTVGEFTPPYQHQAVGDAMTGVTR
ncbi:MAG: ATP-binding cassette domain-containing protein, partial [Chloroflexota bacterium]